MLRAVIHNVKNFFNKRERDIFVKKIAHRVDKDHSGFAPARGDLQTGFMQSQLKAISVIKLPHFLKAIRPAFPHSNFYSRG